MLILKKLEHQHHKGLILDPQKFHFLYHQHQQQEGEKQQHHQIGFHGFHHHQQLQQQNQETPFLNHGGVTSPASKKRNHLAGEEYAPEKMGESYQYHNQQQLQQQQQQQQPTGSSRLGLRTTGGSAGGEIVEVQGGHIVRSTGRKDRHSKVCTAKGPRDRRVRLSAHTAIQFYDVQDRLGYDRPSKAVDWLIKKAKTAIDELAELPAWKPTSTVVSRNPNSSSIQDFEQNPDQLSQFEQHPDDNIVQNSSFLPPSLDSDSIADTIKSFFPMGASSNPANNNTSSSGMQFHQNSRTQDLRLSLQSFQDPILQTEQGHNGNNNTHNHNNNNIYFDGSGWPDNQSSGFQRMVTWGGDANSTGFVFSSPAPAPAPAPAFLFGQTTNNQLFNNNSQRGPLQSSTAPSFRAWIDPPPPQFNAGGAMDQHPTLAFHHPSSIPGYGYASSLSGFSGFRIPARIQGEEEEHDGISDKPSSASSDSRH